jgi:hypothetical protein
MTASNPLEHVSALHTIESLSLDPHLPLFQHYPAMKLGVRESVRFYASLLLPLAEKIIGSRPESTAWTITAPPLYVIPAAANLIAWEVFRTLQKRITPHIPPRLTDLRYSLPNPQNNPDALRGGDYSSSNIDGRIRNRQRLHEGKWAPKLNPAEFRDRDVLVINDINVTGTQQHFIQRTLDAVDPAGIHWLYVFQVDPALGRSHPEIEHTLNFLNIDSFEDLAEVVARADIDYTSRCITRLFTTPIETLGPFLRSLDGARRKRLHDLVTSEGAYTGEAYEARLSLLDQS